MLRIELSLVALASPLLAAYIVCKQRKAESCPAHSRMAGRLAIILAVLTTIAGMCLLAFAWLRF